MLIIHIYKLNTKVHPQIKIEPILILLQKTLYDYTSLSSIAKFKLTHPINPILLGVFP